MSDNDNLGYAESSNLIMNDAVNRDEHNDDEFGQLLSVEVLLPNESADGYIRGMVIKRLKNNLSQQIGTYHADINLDTRMYVVKIV